MMSALAHAFQRFYQFPDGYSRAFAKYPSTGGKLTSSRCVIFRRTTRARALASLHIKLALRGKNSHDALDAR